MFSMELLSFLYISLIQIMKKIVQLSIPCFYDRAFSFFFLSRITRFYTIPAKHFLGEGPQTPPPTHLQCKNYHAICVCVEREGLAIERRSCPTENNLYVNNCLESRFLTPKYVDVFFTLHLWFSMMSLAKKTILCDFNLWTPKYIGVFLYFSPSVYEVWSLHAESIVSYSVNGLKDGQTCKVITIGFRYPRWRCPNYMVAATLFSDDR